MRYMQCNFNTTTRLARSWLPWILQSFYVNYIQIICSIPVRGHSCFRPFRYVAVPVCGHSCLWPFRFVAISVCGRFHLWHSGLWPFRFWPFRFVAVMARNHQKFVPTVLTDLKDNAHVSICQNIRLEVLFLIEWLEIKCIVMKFYQLLRQLHCMHNIDRTYNKKSMNVL